MTAWGGILNENTLRVPPRGITVSTVRIGDKTLHQWTFVCPDSDQCYAIAYSDISEESCKQQVAGHKCPSPVRRGLMPGGTLLEKMWDTADEAMDAYKAGTYYLDEECAGDKLKYYIMCAAEFITFCSTPYFRITEDVLREMQRRWKMRQGFIPFSPTPGYRWSPMPTSYTPDEGPGRQRTADKPVAAKPAKKAAPKKRVVQPQTEIKQFAVEEQAYIAKALHEEGVPAEDLATLFFVSVERIKIVAGPKPGTVEELPTIPFSLF